jgi:hypothetical protein
MSWPERSVQDHRRQTDRAIHRACADLARDPITFVKFQELLLCARERAPRIFEAPIANARHPGVDALVNLARFHDAHVRSLCDWAGTPSSWRPAISSLAHHLTARYQVPAFMASVWHAFDAEGDRKRAWVIAHSRGASFRSLGLPINLTRKMERIFLASQDHLALEPALRRAELLALGMPPDFVKAILSTRLATDLQNGEFWRTVWMFIMSNSQDIDATQIGPMIDYIQAIRHDRLCIETPEGVREIAPPQPGFSVRGRTMASMLRLMQRWHRSLGRAFAGARFSWARSPFRPWMMEEPARDESETPKRWQIVELTNSAQLREEGAALHHCVASYAHLCHRGSSSIWSLRRWQGEKIHPVLTIEVDPKRRVIIQARGKANRFASGKPCRLLHEWASREALQMAI